MRAVVCAVYGPPEALEVRHVAQPELEQGRVLVRVRAASVNAADWHLMRGSPVLARPMMGGLRRPKDARCGGDLSGIVEAVGESVDEFVVGDEVFGSGRGSFAEYVAPLVSVLARKPARLTFEEAAAIPGAGTTALQALRDHGRIEAGQQVLINGGGGGVGTFCVQIAKAFDATVTAVCGPHNIEIVRSLGADQVLDYSSDDFARAAKPYDLVVDIAGSRPIWTLRRLLAPSGRLVVVGAHANPLRHILAAKVANRLTGEAIISFVAKLNGHDLAYLADLASAGKLTPIIDRTYPLEDAADAVRYVETGHARGKVVLTV